jgi:hypothetical protein
VHCDHVAGLGRDVPIPFVAAARPDVAYAKAD